MASPEEQSPKKELQSNGPFFSPGAKGGENDNEFHGFTSEEHEKSSSSALCSKFFVNHKERISNELERSIFLRLDDSCFKCQLTFSSSTHLNKHNEFCGKFSIFVPGTVEYLAQNAEKLRETTSDMLICPWCPVLCAHLVALLKHINKCKEANRKNNAQEKVHVLPCPECPAGYRSLMDLLYHLQCHYIGDVQCSRCNKPFSSTTSLMAHLNKCDMKRVFTCRDCQTPFSDSVSLQHHLTLCESKTQCLKCARVVGSRKLSLDHMIMHLTDEWSKLGLEMVDGTLYRLPCNEIEEAADTAPSPKRKIKRRKKGVRARLWTKKKSTKVEVLKKAKRPKKKKLSANDFEKLQNMMNTCFTNTHPNSSGDSVAEIGGTNSSVKDTSLENVNVSERSDQCTRIGDVSSDETCSAVDDENFYNDGGNETYEIENDAEDPENVNETESFPTELVSNSHEAAILDKDPLDFDTNHLFTPSLEGNDGLTLTVVNVEGGANLFNWDEENDPNIDVENPPEEHLENLLNRVDSNISEVSISCNTQETCDNVDGNEDHDSGIDGTEDGDSNKDKAEDLDDNVESTTSSTEVVSFPDEQVPAKEIFPPHIVYESPTDIVQIEEVIINSELVVSTEVTVSSEVEVSQDVCALSSTSTNTVKAIPKYSVEGEHSYCLPKGQVLPWFKIRALSNKKRRAQNNADCVPPEPKQEIDNLNILKIQKKSEGTLSNDAELGSDNLNHDFDAPKKAEPRSFKSKTVIPSKITTKTKGVRSLLPKMKLSKSILKVSAKKALKTLRKTSLIKHSERTVFGEVCENLLLMAPESSSAKEHSNFLLEPGSSDLSSLEQRCQNSSLLEEINTLTAKDSVVHPIKLEKPEAEKNRKINYSTCVSTRPLNMTVETPKDICDSTNSIDSLEPLNVFRKSDSQDPIDNTGVDEPNGMQSATKNVGNVSNTSASSFIFLTPDKVKLPSDGKLIIPLGLVPLVQKNKVVGYYLPSKPLQKLPNASSLKIFEKFKIQNSIFNNKSEEKPSCTTSSDINIELQKSSHTQQLVGANNPSATAKVAMDQFCPTVTCDKDHTTQTYPLAESKLDKLSSSTIPRNAKEAESQPHNIMGTSVILTEERSKLSSNLTTDPKVIYSGDNVAASSLLLGNCKPINPIKTKSFANLNSENSLITKTPLTAKSQGNNPILSSFMERVPRGIVDRSQTGEKLRNYKKEQSMLLHGFKQIATSFPWKNSVCSTTNPLEEIFISDSSKSSTLKKIDEKICTPDSKPTYNVGRLQPEIGAFRSSFLKLTAEFDVLCYAVRRAPRIEATFNSKSYAAKRNLIKEADKLLLKYKTLRLMDAATSVPESSSQQVKNLTEDNVFKSGLEDFLNDLVNLLDEPNCVSGSDRDVFLMEEDMLTAGLRKLITKCSDTLNDLNPKTSCDSVLEQSNPTQSLMFVVASDGSLQPHPNFESLSFDPSGCSKENLPPAFQSTSLSTLDTVNFDLLSTEKSAIDNVNVFAPPVKKKPLESVLKKTEDSGRDICTSISEEKEQRSKKTSTNADVLKALQSIPNLEHYDVVLMSSSDEDSDGDFNNESCCSPPNVHEDAPEKNSYSSCGNNTEENLLSDSVDRSNLIDKTGLLLNVATDAAISKIEEKETNECNDKFILGKSAFTELNYSKSNGTSKSNQEEYPEKTMQSLSEQSSPRQQSKKGSEKTYCLVVDTLIKEINDKSVNESKEDNIPAASTCSSAVHTNLTETVATDSQGANISQTSVCNSGGHTNLSERYTAESEVENIPQVHLKLPETTKPQAKVTKDQQINECNSAIDIKFVETNTPESEVTNILHTLVSNSPVSLKLMETSAPESEAASVQSSVCNDIVQTKLMESTTIESKEANTPERTLCNSAVQIKEMEIHTSQDKFLHLNDILSKQSKTASKKIKCTKNQTTNVVGRKKWLSHFRTFNYPYRKTMAEIKYFRRRGMGREGLRRATKPYSFSCRQCPLWFNTQRDLERLHVCAKLIVEKKFASEQFDRFFNGEIIKDVVEKVTEWKESEESKAQSKLQEKIQHGEIINNVVEKITEWKESEESKAQSKLQEKIQHEEQKTNNDFEKTNLIKENLLQKGTAENDGLSPLETYVKMKKMRRFICDKCPLKFKSFSTLHQHKIEVHTETLSLMCHICGKQFSRLQKLAVHCAKSHKISLKSENCNKSLPVTDTNSALPAKQIENNEVCKKSEDCTVEEKGEKDSPLKLKIKSYACKMCNRSFLGSGGLQSHINQAHSTLHKCSLCPRRFTYIQKLQKHYFDFHPNSLPDLLHAAVLDKSLTDPSLNEKEVILEKNSSIKHETENCDHVIMDRSLNCSMKINTENKSESGSIPGESLNRPKKRKKTKWRIVNDSTEETISPERSNKTPRLSDGSSEELSPSRSLVISLSKVKKSQYTCNCCSKSFKKHQSLIRHLTDKHKNGPFVCTTCHMEQSDALQLQTHLNQCGTRQCIESFTHNFSSSNHAVEPNLLLSCHKVDELISNDHAQVIKPVNVLDNNKIEDLYAEVTGKSTLGENDTSRQQVANESKCKEQNTVDEETLERSIAEKQEKRINFPILNANEHTVCKTLPINGSPTKLPPSAPNCDPTKSKICNNRRVPKRKTSFRAISDSLCKEELSSIRKPTWIRKGGWKCQVCQKDFGAKGFLERHCIKSHGAPAKYNCPYCGKIFIDYRSLRIHHKAKHNKKKWLFVDKNVDNSSLPLLPNCSENSEGSFETADDQTVLKKCGLCDKAFRRNIDLKRHKNRHHNNRTAIKCPLCKLQFESKTGLALHHSEIHAKETGDEEAFVLLPENHCPSNSSNSLDAGPSDPSSALQENDKSVYTSEAVLLSEKKSSEEEKTEEFQCADCPLAYKKYSCLKRHRILMHAEPANYYCTICGKGFSYPHSLKNHVMTHSRGELNSKRSDRCGKGTWKKRRAIEEKLNSSPEETCSNLTGIGVLHDSSGDAVQNPQLVQPKSPPPSSKSGENSVFLNTPEESCSKGNTLAGIAEENGVHCTNSNDSESKTAGHESFAPSRSEEEACITNCTNAPPYLEFREEPHSCESGATSYNTMPGTELSAPSAYPSWNGNSFPSSSLAIGDNQWMPPFQNSEALNTCSICGLCLPSWYSLQEHYYTAHPNPNFYAPPVTYQTYPQNYPTYNNYNPFYGGSFPNHHAPPSESGSSSSFQELTSHSVAHCSVCSLCFPNLLALQEHYATHLVSLSTNPAFQNAGFY